MSPVRLPEIAASSWEHPTDRAALAALKKLPAFDSIIRKVIGAFGESNVRMLFQASAVKVGPTQYPELHDTLIRVCHTLDAEVPELYVSQGPMANAGAVGVDKPFIVLQSSLVEMATPAQVEAVVGHEVGHILSEHALYRTLLFLLLRLVQARSPLFSAAMMPITLALLEWNRKAEISCDRAGLLAVQDVDASLGVLGVLAGGIRGANDDFDLEAFIAQSDEYRDTKGLQGFFRFVAMMGQTHPFAVVRVAELRNWIESGDYHRIIEGDYRKRGDDDTSLRDDVSTAATDFSDRAQSVFHDAQHWFVDTLDNFSERVEDFLNNRPDGAGDGTADDSPAGAGESKADTKKTGGDDDDPLDGYIDDWPIRQ